MFEGGRLIFPAIWRERSCLRIHVNVAAMLSAGVVIPVDDPAFGCAEEHWKAVRP